MLGNMNRWDNAIDHIIIRARRHDAPLRLLHSECNALLVALRSGCRRRQFGLTRATLREVRRQIAARMTRTA